MDLFIHSYFFLFRSQFLHYYIVILSVDLFWVFSLPTPILPGYYSYFNFSFLGCYTFYSDIYFLLGFWFSPYWVSFGYSSCSTSSIPCDLHLCPCSLGIFVCFGYLPSSFLVSSVPFRYYLLLFILGLSLIHI